MEQNKTVKAFANSIKQDMVALTMLAVMKKFSGTGQAEEAPMYAAVAKLCMLADRDLRRQMQDDPKVGEMSMEDFLVKAVTL